jgi:hypothetical protein
MIHIKHIDSDDVIKYDKERFNSNNHGQQPSDYANVLRATYTHSWIDKFHSQYKVINLYSNDLQWLKEANEISSKTGKFTEIYREELNQFVTKYDPFLTDKFIRSENVSLKYGQHGAGPYNNMEQVIESLVSSINGHSPIYPDTEHIKLYLLPWLKIDPWKEFRVFVYKNKITAISQQNLHNYYPELTVGKINLYGILITNYFNTTLKNKIDLDSYTYDFALLDDDKPYFIELNSFGKEYASGSALFHWLLDEDILYNEDGIIEFRYNYK